MRSVLPIALVLASCVTAQGSIVSPAHFTNAEGPFMQNLPFGVNISPIRYMQIHDDLQGPPQSINGFSLRRNAQAPASGAHSVTLDAWCSTAATVSQLASTAFDNNHGVNRVQVITSMGFNFPATQVGDVPLDFTFDVPFDAVYAFDGSGPLCLEIQKTAHTNSGGYFMDAAFGSGNTNPPLAFVSYGTGCRFTGAAANMTATGASSMNWPANSGVIRVTGANGPANGLVIVFLGLSNQLAFGSVPLPFLIPGSATAPSGPCNLLADMVLITGSATSATGTSTTDFAFPATAALNGIRTFEQILASAPAANPAGIVTSNAVNHNVVAPYGAVPGCRIYASGGLPVFGTIDRISLLVTRFNL